MQVSIPHLQRMGRYFVEVIPIFKKVLNASNKQTEESGLDNLKNAAAVITEFLEKSSRPAKIARTKGISRESSAEQIDVDDVSEEEAEWFLHWINDDIYYVYHLILIPMMQ